MNMGHKTRRIILAVSFLLSAGAVQAQTTVFNGWDNGAGDNLWSSADNWIPNRVPGSDPATWTDQIRMDSGAEVILNAAVPSPNRWRFGGSNTTSLLTVNSGASLTVAGSNHSIGTSTSSDHSLILNGGNLIFGGFTAGGGADTTSLVQFNGGSYTGNLTLTAGANALTTGELLGGTHTINVLTLGNTATQGQVRFLFGDENGTATWSGSGTGQSYIRQNAATDVEFVGHGVVGLTGAVFINGRVIADGYGSDRNLDLSSASGVQRIFTDNATLTSWTGGVSGYYARNGGRLLLPSIPMTGSSAFHPGEWGDTQDAQGMVNSVYTTFSVGQGSNRMSIALLAPDRADVHSPPAGATFIGVWDVTSPVFSSSATATLTFRYDMNAMAAAGLLEEDLLLWHYTGGQWVDAFGSIDTTNKLLTSTPVTAFSPFAIGGFGAVVTGVVPEPGTLVLLGFAGLLAGVRRRRRP